jgi:hypothetical protein
MEPIKRDLVRVEVDSTTHGADLLLHFMIAAISSSSVSMLRLVAIRTDLQTKINNAFQIAKPKHERHTER